MARQGVQRVFVPDLAVSRFLLPALLCFWLGSPQDASGAIIVTVSGSATYLHTVAGDRPSPPTVVDLGANGLFPGDLLLISYETPDPFSFFGGPPFSLVQDAPLLGVFSSSNVILHPVALLRVPGAIEAGVDEESFSDIPHDFRVTPHTGLLIEVPPGATTLVLGAGDSFWEGNAGTFVVTIQHGGHVPAPVDPAQFAQAPGPLNSPDVTTVSKISDASRSGIPNVTFGQTGEEQGALPPDDNAPRGYPYVDDYVGASQVASLAPGVECKDCSPPAETLVGNPVHLYSGRVHQNLTDIRLTSCVGNVVFERSYSSGSTRSGGLGVGWSHTFERMLFDLGPEGVVEVDGREVSLRFPPDGQGGYGPPLQGGARLTREPDNSWTVRYVTGRTYRYRPTLPSGTRAGSTITVTVAGSATYLHTVAGDNPSPPTLVDLRANGLIPGDLLLVSYATPAPFSFFGGPPFSSVQDAPLGGVFSSSDTILPPSASHRVPGAIEAGLDHETFSDIPQDFRITPHTGMLIEVPPGATTLALGALDSFWVGNAGLFVIPIQRRDHIPGGAGKLASIEDAFGNRSTLEYSSRDELVRITDCSGRSLQFEVEDGLIQRIRSSAGQEIHYAYTEDRRLAAASDLLGGVTTYTYQSTTGDLRRTTRPSGDRTDYVYDDDRRVIEVHRVNPTLGDSLSLIDYPSSTVRLFTDPVGRVTRYEFSSGGQLLRRIHNDGSIYSITYDIGDRPTSVTYPDGGIESWGYDASGSVTSYTSPAGRTTRVERDPMGRPTTLVHPDGTTLQREYDGAGFLLRSTDALGRERSFSRDEHGQTVEVVDAPGRRTRNHFDADTFLVSMEDAAAGTTRYTRDALGRPTATISPGGRITGAEFLGMALYASSTAPGGFTTRYDRDALGRVSTITLPDGGQYKLTWQSIDGRDVVTRVEDPLGHVSINLFDPSGRQLSHTDALLRTTRYELDALGRIAAIVDPCGARTTIQYTPRGFISSIQNARGALTSLTYDPDGFLHEATMPDATQNAWSLDPMGRITTFTNAEGGVEGLTYDAVGQPVTRTDPMEKVWRTEYTLNGVVQKTIDASDGPTTYRYDDLDRLLEVTDPLGHVRREEHAPDGERVLSVDMNGNQTQEIFDAAQRLVMVRDPLGHAVVRTHDAMGRVITLTDENSNTWRYSYDLAGRLSAEIDPAGRVKTFEYNAANELVAVIHADGSAWRYERDCAGRVLQRKLLRADGSAEDVEQFVYDLVGNILSSENAAVKSVSEYDLMDRETRRTVTYKTTNVTRSLKVTFDAMGRRQLVVDSHGRLVGYEYDKNSRLVRLTVMEPNPRSTSLANAYLARSYIFRWDDVGNLLQVDYPNGTRTLRTYDAANRLTQLAHVRVEGAGTVPLASWTLTRDNNGNIHRVVEQGGEEWIFEHDSRNQLINARLPRGLVTEGAGASTEDEEEPARLLRQSATARYRYDPAGNRVQEDYAGRVISSSFGPVNEMLTRGRARYTYDLRGQQVERVLGSGRRETFDFSVAGNLTQFSVVSTGGTRKRGDYLGAVSRYLYSPDSERVLAEDLQNQQVVGFLWDEGAPIEEWARSTVASRNTAESRIQYLRDLGGDLLEQQEFGRLNGNGSTQGNNGVGNGIDPAPPGNPPLNDGPGTGPGSPGRKGGSSASVAASASSNQSPAPGRISWIHGDWLGSTRLMTDLGAQATARMTYGPWGEELAGNFGATRFTYAGTQREPATNLQYMWHRWYSPTQGRFLSRDPIGFDGGQINLYGYVGNSPIDRRDPTGLGPFSTMLRAVGVELINIAFTLEFQAATVGAMKVLNLCMLDQFFAMQNFRMAHGIADSAEDVAKLHQLMESRQELKRLGDVIKARAEILAARLDEIEDALQAEANREKAR